MTKEKISIFPLWTFHLYVAAFQHACIWSIYLSVDTIFQSCSYHDFLDRGLLLTRKLLNHGFLMVNLDFESFTVATMTWLTILFVVFTIWSFLNSWLITRVVTRVTQQVSHVEQKLFNLLKHLSSAPVFSVVCIAQFLVFNVCLPLTVQYCFSELAL
jgi:hypothetical protein